MTTHTTSSLKPVLEFMVDTGSSMGDSDVPSTHGQTKWAATREVLRQTFAALPSNWAVGVAYFNLPSGQSSYQGAQAVPIAPLTGDQLAAIDASLDAVVPAARRPLLAAWVCGRDQALSFASSAPGWGGRHVVLVTDSVPTVNPDGVTPGGGPNGTITEAEYETLIQTVGAEMQLDHIKTFVAGVPGSEDPQGALYDPLYQLSRLAGVGGSGLVGCTPAPGTVLDCHDTAEQRPSTCLAARGTYCHLDLTTTSDLATPYQLRIRHPSDLGRACDRSERRHDHVHACRRAAPDLHSIARRLQHGRLVLLRIRLECPAHRDPVVPEPVRGVRRERRRDRQVRLHLPLAGPRREPRPAGEPVGGGVSLHRASLNAPSSPPRLVSRN